MYNRTSGKSSAVGLVAIVLVAAGAFSVIPHCSRSTYRATVTGKDSVIDVDVSTDDDGDTHTKVSSKYIVFAELENEEPKAFYNTNSLLEWKFNSSELQAKLKEGKKFDIQAYGWRVPFLSWYENIVNVTPVKEEPTETK